MKITSAWIYPLKIPFVSAFSHSLAARNYSDSVVVKVTDDAGISGFGEGVPRPYVTGETREACVEHIRKELLPRIESAVLTGIDLKRVFRDIDNLFPETTVQGSVVWNASRCAVELAIIDCLFRRHRISLNKALPPVAKTVTYSGVITSGTTARVRKTAQRFKGVGFSHVKMKVSGTDDVEHVALVRAILGPSVSIRLDANAAFSLQTALQFLKSVEKYDIQCIEQPIPRGHPAELARLRVSSPIPLMADESIVTIDDARVLIEMKAVDSFNLRLSKCGGLHQTLAIAELALSAGIEIQLGCQVGETAILSAAGRHLAAYLPDLRFVEGSYGTFLLREDISEEEVVFGPAGIAPLLSGPGLGITVREDLLDKYAEGKVSVY